MAQSEVVRCLKPDSAETAHEETDRFSAPLSSLASALTCERNGNELQSTDGPPAFRFAIIAC